MSNTLELSWDAWVGEDGRPVPGVEASIAAEETQCMVENGTPPAIAPVGQAGPKPVFKIYRNAADGGMDVPITPLGRATASPTESGTRASAGVERSPTADVSGGPCDNVGDAVPGTSGDGGAGSAPRNDDVKASSQRFMEEDGGSTISTASKATVSLSGGNRRGVHARVELCRKAGHVEYSKRADRNRRDEPNVANPAGGATAVSSHRAGEGGGASLSVGHTPRETKRRRETAGIAISGLSGKLIADGLRWNHDQSGGHYAMKVVLLVWHLGVSGKAKDLELLLTDLQKEPDISTKQLRVLLFGEKFSLDGAASESPRSHEERHAAMTCVRESLKVCFVSDSDNIAPVGHG